MTDEELQEGTEQGGCDAKDGQIVDVPENPLTRDIIGDCLSLLCKIGTGLGHAFVRLDVHEKEITDINILSSYPYLRYVDLTKNHLTDLKVLSYCSQLLTLKADHNRLKSASLPDFPYLQVASFNNNNITDTEGISLPLLEYLSLSCKQCLPLRATDNKINRVTGLNASVLSNLHTLELRGNGLTNTDGLAIPTLKNLFLAENFITEITGLEVLTHLTTLHLRDNLVQSLSGYSANMKSLQYVNLRNNKVSDLMEVDKLSCLPRIRALILSECPLAEQEEYRIEVLICLRRLERLDKFEYTEEDRREAEDLYEQRQEREITSENAAGY